MINQCLDGRCVRHEHEQPLALQLEQSPRGHIRQSTVSFKVLHEVARLLQIPRQQDFSVHMHLNRRGFAVGVNIYEQAVPLQQAAGNLQGMHHALSFNSSQRP